MEIHIIVSILLDYGSQLENWTSTRLLCTQAKEIVSKKKYDDGCFGARSMIRTQWCMICQKTSPEAAWLTYSLDNLTDRRYITHCPTWQCRISALRSMIADYKCNDNVLLRKPWRKETQCEIPRSRGGLSHGKCKLDGLWFKNGQYYVLTKWDENNETFVKSIPLTYYTNDTPKIIDI